MLTELNAFPMETTKIRRQIYKEIIIDLEKQLLELATIKKN
ncbi:MAG: hypothetical protein ACXAC7_14950 [Candidatus Hodarchaeales archaeon]